MTRQDAIERILAIVDAAAPPVAPVVDSEPAASSETKRAARQRGALSSSSPSQDPAKPSTGAAAPSPPPPSNVIFAFSQSSHSGGRRKRNAAKKDGEDGEGLHKRCSGFPHTDLGNAERFVARNQGRFLWCPALGWLFWDGRRWASDGADEKLREAFHQTVRAIQVEAKVIDDEAKAILVPDDEDDDGPVGPDSPKERKARLVKAAEKLRKWGRASEANKAISAIEKNAQPYLYVDVRELDADPMLINLANGALELGRDHPNYVKLRPHEPDDLCTKISDVVYDPQAKCEAYDKFFAEVQPDEAMRRFLHQWGGYSLTGDASEQKLIFNWGKGKNGKSTLFDAWGHVAGDYGRTAPIETFLVSDRARSGSQASPDRAMLKGVRYLRTSEPGKGAAFDEAFVKLVTGSEPVPARELNMPIFEFRPEFKLTMSGNYRPRIGGTDEGIWRRVRLVPWTFTVTREDRALGKKLKDEASGILNRLLGGLRDWLDNGLEFPEAVERATAEYREDSDVIGQFLADCTVVEAGARTQSSILHSVLNAWQKARGDREWSNKAMTGALIERGLQKKKSNGEWWLDLKLTKHEGDFVDGAGRPREPSARPAAAEIKDDDIVPL